MRISRSLAGPAIATGVLGASLGLGLTMASASTSASPAVTHSAAARTQAASAARSSRRRRRYRPADQAVHAIQRAGTDGNAASVPQHARPARIFR